MKMWKRFDMIAYARTITPHPAPPGCCAGGYELLDPAQQLNRPRLLVVIEKKRLMCTTHSASLREQPNGWWI